VSKSDWKALSGIGAIIALVLDLSKAAEHRQTCPKCIPRDYVTVALDVFHLAELA
jgi:hypothetical protein